MWIHFSGRPIHARPGGEVLFVVGCGVSETARLKLKKVGSKL